MSIRRRLLCGAALCALVFANEALAQGTPPVASQMQLLQQQIQQLQQQLQSLQNQVNAQAQQPAPVAAAAPPPPPGPHITQSPTNRFSIESADGKYSIGLTTQLHFDMGGYAYHPDAGRFGLTTPAGEAPHDLNSGVNARRARFGFLGKLDGDWGYTFVYDFGGSQDTGAGGTTNAGVGDGIEKAYVTYNGLYHNNMGTAFDLGYQDMLYTLDESTSSNDIMFMERGSAGVVSTELGAGDFRSGAGVRSNDSRYWAGIYLTGPQSGGNHTDGTGAGEPLSMFGRLTYQVLSAPDYSLHFGVEAIGMLHPPTSAAGIRSITLSDRPELRIDPTSILTTGTVLGTQLNPLNGAQSYGFEVAGGYQNLFMQGEGYDYQIEREGLPTNNFYGGYLEGSWTVTGEHRNYIPSTGAYSGIIPAHPFSWSAGQLGAFELAVRYSYVNLNDNVGSAPAAAAAAAAGTAQTSNGVAGGQQSIVTLGLNWYVNSNIRFMFNYLHGTIDKPGTGGGINAEGGAKFDALAMRTQVAF